MVLPAFQNLATSLFHICKSQGCQVAAITVTFLKCDNFKK
jgi:hypothetical protein